MTTANARGAEDPSSSIDVTTENSGLSPAILTDDELRSIYDSIVDGMIVLRRDSRMAIHVNEAFQRMTGYAPADLSGDVLDLLDLSEKRKTALNTLLVSGEEVKRNLNLDLSVIRKDGSRFLAECTARGIDWDGTPAIVVFLHDVSQQDQAGAGLSAGTEERYRTLVEYLYDAVYVIQDSRLTFVNPRFEALTGYSREELLSPDFRIDRLFTGASRRLLHSRIEARRQGREIAPSSELIIRRKDGDLRVVDNSKVDLDPQTPGMQLLGVMRDISERKHAEWALRASEEKNRALIEALPDTILILDREGTILDYKSGLEGESRDEGLGLQVTQHYGEEAGTRIIDQVNALLDEESEGERTVEFRSTMQGNVQDLEARMAPLGANEVICVVRDMTARKRAEEEQRLLLTAIEATDEAVVVTDTTGRIEYVNNAFERITGYAREEAAGQNPRILKSGKHQDHFYKDLWNTISEGTSWTKRFINRRKDGSLFNVESTISPVFGSDGEVKHYTAVVRDITERLEAEEALRRSHQAQTVLNELLRTTLSDMSLDELLQRFLDTLIKLPWLSTADHASIMLYDAEKDLLRLRASKGFTSAMFRRCENVRTGECICGKVAQSLEPVHVVSHHDVNQERHPELDEHGHFCIPVIAPGGRLQGVVNLYLKPGANLAKPETEFLDSVVTVISSIITHKTTEAENHRLAEFPRQNPNPIIATNLQGEVLHVNPAAIRVVEEANLEKIEQLLPDDHLVLLKQCRETREKVTSSPTRAGERVFSFAYTFVPANQQIYMYGFEITERIWAEEALRESEQRLRQSQKMEAIGQLAGGVAHDFNNLLTVINGHAQMLIYTLAENDDRRMGLEQISKAGMTAASLTRQLLAFSRKQVLQPRVMCLVTAVREMEKMIERLLGKDIHLVIDKKQKHLFIEADPNQIEQVILNLAVNARDAMPDGGTLHISLGESKLEAGKAESLQVREGRYARMSVRDTGTGMPDEVMQKIFEPFFTTKQTGKGTGLGLSTVYGIIKQSHGGLTVESELGQGTDFQIYLPSVSKSVRIRHEEKKTEEQSLRGYETVLLVEDDEMVRSFAGKVLIEYGYRVLEASGSGEALLIAEKEKGNIDILFSDMVMPLLRGNELAERLVKLYPKMKVLLASGYANDEGLLTRIREQGFPFLQKPYDAHALASALRNALDK